MLSMERLRQEQQEWRSPFGHFEEDEGYVDPEYTGNRK